MKKKSQFQIYGLFGNPLSHSLSPAIQECALNQKKILAHYLLFETSKRTAQSIFRNLKKSSISGFNLTVPYKETVIPYLDEISREAQSIGAVNTVYRRGQKWLGENTDVYGFLTALKADGKFSPSNKTVCVLGAGGAAKAVIYGLASSGASKIFLLNRSLKRAQNLKKKLRLHFSGTEIETGEINSHVLKKAILESALIVNTTSVGLKKTDSKLFSDSFIPKSSSGNRKLFYDLIYFPQETQFLSAAKKKGHAVLNGAGMLVYQGAKAFECWTGLTAPSAEMKNVFKLALAQKRNLK